MTTKKTKNLTRPFKRGKFIPPIEIKPITEHNRKGLYIQMTRETNKMLDMLAETYCLTHSSIVRWALETIFWSTLDHYEEIKQTADLFNLPVKFFKNPGYKPSVINLTKNAKKINKWQEYLDKEFT